MNTSPNHTTRWLATCLAGLILALPLMPALAAQQDDEADADRQPPSAREDSDGHDDSDRDRRRDDDRRDRDRRDDFDLSPEQIDQALELVRMRTPEIADRLQQLREDDPEKFEHVVDRIDWRLHHLLREHRRDPEGFKLRAEEHRLRFQAHRLADRLQDAEGEEAEQLKQELRNTLEQEFQARIAVHEHELTQLQQRIQDLRDEIAHKREQMQQLIDERYQRLLDDPYPGPHHRGPDRDRDQWEREGRDRNRDREDRDRRDDR